MKRIKTEIIPASTFQSSYSTPYKKKYKKKNYKSYDYNAPHHPEIKYFDTGFSGLLAAVTTVWPAITTDPATFLTLCVPSLGNDINNRIGRKIGVKKIKLRGDIDIPAVTTTGGDSSNAVTFRYILVVDTQTNGAQMSGATLMSGGANAGITINSFQNLIALGRFKVLKDKRISLMDPNFQATNGDTNGIHRLIKVNHTFKKPLIINFNSTNGGTIADIVDNSLHFIVQADDITRAPLLQYACRVSYMDL